MARPSVLHVLPHRGGGGEVLVDLLSRLDGYRHERDHLSASRDPIRGAPSIAAGVVRLRRRAAAVDLVHVVGDVAAMLLLPVLRRNPAVFSTQGLHFLRRARGVSLALARRRIARVVVAADRTVCSSAAERAELEAILGPRRPVRLVEVANGVPLPPPIDPARRSAARAELELAEHQVACLYLGELEPRKRALTAVRAARSVGSGGVPFVLLVAGDGPEAAQVRAQAGATVRALGFRTDPERLLAAADLFVMPSEREGLSLALLEAMGHGLATVVSDGPGNPEAVGEAGVVVPVGDETALADALARLARDPDERGRLGAAARERVRRRFGVERYLDDMRSVYDQVLASAERSA